MADTTARHVSVRRSGTGRFVIVNDRGGQLPLGSGTEDGFTPTELLLGAIGACTSIDVDILTSRRAEPEAFEVDVRANKVRDDDGNRMTDVEVTFRVSFPAGDGGDAARELLPEAVRRSHDRLCTVSRTVEVGTPIATRVE